MRVRNVNGKKIYTSQDKSDWNLYKVSVWMGRKLYKPVQIRGLYKKKERYGKVVKKKNCGKELYKKLMIIVIGLFFWLYFSQSISRRQAGSLVPAAL